MRSSRFQPYRGERDAADQHARATNQITTIKSGEYDGLTTNHIRHELTDYEWLMNINGPGQGLTRDEARLVVAAEVRDIFDEWRDESAQSDRGLRRITRQFVRSRKDFKRMCQALSSEEAKSAEDQLIREENAALTDYLSRWLDARRSPTLDPTGEGQSEALQDEHH
jgi:hypothetical protein